MYKRAMVNPMPFVFYILYFYSQLYIQDNLHMTIDPLDKFLKL